VKRCSKCRIEKPLSEFWTDQHKDGKRSECKICRSIIAKQWREHNIEYCKLKDKETYKKRWYSGYRTEYAREWYQKNKERVRQKQREYYLKHKEACILKTARYRARKAQLECSLTVEQWDTIKKIFRNRCAYCGKRTKRLEKEHVIPVVNGGSLTLHNIIPACRKCNATKADNLPNIPVKLILL